MIKRQKAKGKRQNLIILASLIFLIGHWSLVIGHSNTYAVSPTITPIASPSATPTTSEDEKIKEIRETINKKVNEIKEKIEKKAFVGKVTEITDSTLTLINFRGKRRIRLIEGTKIIGSAKKEITAKDLAVDDKIIAMGEIKENEILEAKRLIVVPPPQSPPPKRMVFFGIVTVTDVKKSLLTLTSVENIETKTEFKVDKETNILSQKDSQSDLKLKDLTQNQKTIIIYPQPAEGKTALAKTIFLLP